MKKLMIPLLMIFSIATSLIAGTFATYSQTIDNLESTVYAKEFKFGASGIDNFNDSVKIAPGETLTKKFLITNTINGITSEVAMDIDVRVTIEGADDKLPIQSIVAAIKNDNDEYITNNFLRNGEGYYDIKEYLDLFPTSKTFTIEVMWVSSSNDNDYMGDAFANVIKVTAVATQCVHENHDSLGYPAIQNYNLAFTSETMYSDAETSYIAYKKLLNNYDSSIVPNFNPYFGLTYQTITSSNKEQLKQMVFAQNYARYVSKKSYVSFKSSFRDFKFFGQNNASTLSGKKATGLYYKIGDEMVIIMDDGTILINVSYLDVLQDVESGVCSSSSCLYYKNNQM